MKACFMRKILLNVVKDVYFKRMEQAKANNCVGLLPRNNERPSG